MAGEGHSSGQGGSESQTASGGKHPNSRSAASAVTTADREAIEYLLDGWHLAAASSDEQAYFEVLSADAVFLGTDATERWTRAEFQAYAHPHFAAGRGWKMHATRREVVVRGGLAWFDEDLETLNLGPARGSGICSKQDSGLWRLDHYVLSSTIPNQDLASVKRLLESNAQQRDLASTASIVGQSSPRLKVLGIAQDGGVPHAGCSCTHCVAARTSPTQAHMVASLAVIVPVPLSSPVGIASAGVRESIHLIDATPDLARQLELLPNAGQKDPGGGNVLRAPIASVFLTHAHIGHYLGLAQLGFEVLHAQGVKVYASERMATFLSSNGPWDQLVKLGEIQLTAIEAANAVSLDGGVKITPVVVPHRDEYSDTVGYRIQGPHKTVLYIPDTEPWERWSVEFDAALEGVDIALLDATFYSANELGGRATESIGHPLVIDTVKRLAPKVERGELEIVLIHLNHSNPLLDDQSDEAKRLRVSGFRVAREGEEISL